jgi:hypothetical protein
MPRLNAVHSVGLALNATLLPLTPGNRQTGMQWLPDYALGVLRFIQ